MSPGQGPQPSQRARLRIKPDRVFAGDSVRARVRNLDGTAQIMPTCEIVLRHSSRDGQVPLTDHCEAEVGDTVVINGREWVAESVEPPTGADATKRIVFRLAAAVRAEEAQARAADK